MDRKTAKTLVCGATLAMLLLWCGVALWKIGQLPIWSKLSVGPKGQTMILYAGAVVVGVLYFVIMTYGDRKREREYQRRADRVEGKAWRVYHKGLTAIQAAEADRREDTELYEAVERTYEVAQACGVSMAELKAVLNHVRESCAEKGSDSMLTVQQQRVKAVILRAQSILLSAAEQMHNVADGGAATVEHVENAVGEIKDALDYFDKDASAYNDAVESDRIDAAELQKKAEEDAAVDTLLQDGEASFDDRGKQIDTPVRNAAGETIKDVLARNKNVVEPPEPWPEPKVDDDDGPKRDCLSDFGEGSDQ
jgi:hypothetical protein